MLRALDLFAGIGAFSHGLHRTAGFETVAVCEKADWKRPILAEMLPGVPIYPDVTELTGRRVLDDVGPIDIVVGSPPCTDASSANTAGRGVDGDETGLFFEAVRLVGETRPVWFVLENVDRLRTRGEDRVLDALDEQAYACWPLVVGALHAGAPHIRKRVWFVGFSADAHAERIRQQPGRGGGPGEDAGAHDPADPGGPGPSLWESLGRDHAGQLQALERDVGPAIHQWAGGLGRYLRVADGLPAGTARMLMSACGDAVVEGVVEVVAQAILDADAAWRDGRGLGL